MNLRKVRALAGDLWFARGEAYFQEGRVKELIEHNGKHSAIVSGTHGWAEFHEAQLATLDTTLVALHSDVAFGSFIPKLNASALRWQ